MADNGVFTFLADALEQESSLDRLEARGTIRLALKQAGLDARTVTCDQMKVVLRSVLPAELAARGIADEAGICTKLSTQIDAAGFDEVRDDSSPDAVFARLGG